MPATRFERNGAVVGGAITVRGGALVAWWSPTETTTINNGEERGHVRAKATALACLTPPLPCR